MPFLPSCLPTPPPPRPPPPPYLVVNLFAHHTLVLVLSYIYRKLKFSTFKIFLDLQEGTRNNFSPRSGAQTDQSASDRPLLSSSSSYILVADTSRQSTHNTDRYTPLPPCPSLSPKPAESLHITTGMCPLSYYIVLRM